MSDAIPKHLRKTGPADVLQTLIAWVGITACAACFFQACTGALW